MMRWRWGGFDMVTWIVIPIALAAFAVASGYIGYIVGNSKGKAEAKRYERTMNLLVNRVIQMEREMKKAKEEHYLTD